MTVLISSIGDTFQGKCGVGIHVASFIKGVIGISDLSNGVKQYRMIGNVIPETVYLGPCIILQTGCAAGGIGCIIDGIIKGEGRKAKCTIAQQLSISFIRMVRKQVLYAVNRSNAGYGTSILIIINFSTIDRTPCVYFETAVVVKTIIGTIDFLDTIVAFIAILIKIALIVPAINQKRTVFLCTECVRSVIRSVITEFCIFDQITMFVEIVFFAVNLANFILVPDTIFISVTYITVIIGIPAGSKIVLG